MNEKLTMTSTESNSISCEYFPLCSGCRKQDALFEHNKHKKLEHELGREIPFIVDGVIHWRHRAKLAIGGSSKSPKIGLYQENSHVIIPIPKCPLHTLSINKAIKKIVESIVESRISIYSEKTFKGVLRYVQIVEEIPTKKVSLSFVINGSIEKTRTHPFFQVLKKNMGEVLMNLWLNEKKTQDNAIFGPDWGLIVGRPYVNQNILKKPYLFHPAAFCQVHLKQYENVLRKIRSWIQNNPIILELYAGIGTIGKSVADLAEVIYSYESNPYAKECFEQSQKIQCDSNVNFFPLPSEEFEIRDYHLAIIDPPRKGMSKKVIKKIAECKKLKDLVVLYCDSDSFLKDEKVLKEEGFKLMEIETYLFFPGSDHIEVLAYFKKESE